MAAAPAAEPLSLVMFAGALGRMDIVTGGIIANKVGR